MFANRTATRGHADPTSNDAAGESVGAASKHPANTARTDATCASPTHPFRRAAGPIASSNACATRRRSEYAQVRTDDAGAGSIALASIASVGVDEFAGRPRVTRHVAAPLTAAETNARVSVRSRSRRLDRADEEGASRRANFRSRSRRRSRFRLRRRWIRGTLRVDRALGRGAAWRAGVSPSPRPPPRALPPEATPRDWRARTRPRRRRNARRDLRVWRRRRPAVSDRNRRPADPTRPSVPRATRDREPGWEEGRPRRRLEGPGQNTTAWWSSVWSSRSRARKVRRRIVVSGFVDRRETRTGSRSVFQEMFPLKTRRGPTRTSSPSSSTSSLSGYITSNVPSGAVSSSNSSAVSGSRAFVPRLRNGSRRSTVLHGSHLFGSTNPRERSRHTDAPSVDRRNGPINSAMSTPRSDARRTSRAASATRRVGTTSTSRMPSSGTPRTIQGVVAPSRGGGSEDEPSEDEPSPGTCSASHGPNQWHFRVNTAHMRSEQPLVAFGLRSNAGTARRVSVRRLHRSPRNARVGSDGSSSCDSGTSAISSGSVTHHPRRWFALACPLGRVRAHDPPRVRRPVADKRGTRVKFVRTRVAFETRAGSPPPRPPPRPPRGVRSERCSGRGSLRPRGVPRPPREPTVHAGMTRQRQLTTRLGDANV